MTAPYLDRKEIDLADLQRVCRANVSVKAGKIALFDSDENFSGYHRGVFVYRELVNLVNDHVGAERILDQKIDQSSDGKLNDKLVEPGTDTSGFTPIGFDPSDFLEMTGELTVCAGLAEGYRIHQATGRPVACCVGEANIPKIARQLASFTRPDKLRISVAVDNDKAGRLAALRSGFPYTMPRTEKDFSDVYQHGGGIEEVRWQVEWDWPPLEAATRQAEIDRLTGRDTKDYRPPMNTLTLDRAGSAMLGVVGLLDIPKPHLIDGYEHFKTVAASMGSEPLDDQGHDQWVLTNADEFGLVMGMMDAGLKTSLREIPMLLTSLESNFFEAIHEGLFDDVPIVGGAPALVTLGEDAHGKCLVVDSDYDPMIAQICKDAKGFFDKNADQWRISINTPGQREKALTAIADNPLRRFMFPSPDEEGYWVVATPWTKGNLATLLDSQPQPADRKVEDPAFAEPLDTSAPGL